MASSTSLFGGPRYSRGTTGRLVSSSKGGKTTYYSGGGSTGKPLQVVDKPTTSGSATETVQAQAVQKPVVTETPKATTTPVQTSQTQSAATQRSLPAGYTVRGSATQIGLGGGTGLAFETKQQILTPGGRVVAEGGSRSVAKYTKVDGGYVEEVKPVSSYTKTRETELQLQDLTYKRGEGFVTLLGKGLEKQNLAIRGRLDPVRESFASRGVTVEKTASGIVRFSQLVNLPSFIGEQFTPESAKEGRQKFVEGAIRYPLDRPASALNLAAVSFSLPTLLTGAGKAAGVVGQKTGLTSVATKIGSTFPKVTSYAISTARAVPPTLYLGSSAVQIASAEPGKRAEKAGEIFAKTAIVGLSYLEGQKFGVKMRGFAETYGRPEVSKENIILKESLAGEKYPREFISKQQARFYQESPRIPGSKKPTSVSTTGDRFWADAKPGDIISIKPGSSEIPGLWGAPKGVKTYLRLPGDKSSVSLYSGKLLPQTPRPGILVTEAPKGISVMKVANVKPYSVTVGGQTGTFKQAFVGTQPTGKMFIPDFGVPYEELQTVTSIGQSLKVIGQGGFVRLAGVRVPIDYATLVTAKTAPTIGEATGVLIGSGSSGSSVASYSLASPTSLGLSSLQATSSIISATNVLSSSPRIQTSRVSVFSSSLSQSSSNRLFASKSLISSGSRAFSSSRTGVPSRLTAPSTVRRPDIRLPPSTPSYTPPSRPSYTLPISSRGYTSYTGRPKTTQTRYVFKRPKIKFKLFGQQNLFKSSRFKGRYTPSLKASVFKIKGKKPTKFEIMSGLFTRPLTL